MNSKSEKPIRLAIVGSGSIAQVHAAAIARIPEAQLVAVCARNRERAKELGAPALAHVAHSMDELLAWGEFDGVLIATPSGAHAESALPALRATKHVLCEKPLEIETARVNAMIEAANSSNVILAGFFPLRCGAGAKAIHQALTTGRFGRLTFLSARIKWWRDQSYYDGSNWRGTWELDGGGALMNQGIHAVDLMQWLGGPISEVAAFSATLAHQGLAVEDSVTASMRFANGALGTLEAATSCYPGLALSLEISGDRGTAILSDDRIESWNFADECAEDESIRSGRIGGEIGGGSSDPKAISSEGHRQQIVAFCRAIRGESSEVIGGVEAGHAVAIVEAIYRSCRSKQSEPVKIL